MSVKISSKVWDNAPYEGKKLLILLAMADFADDEGLCWPNQETLAAKARCTVEYVRKATKDLVQAGHLEVVREASSHRSRRYRLTPSLLGENQLPPTENVTSPNSEQPLPPTPGLFSPNSAWGEPLEPSENLEPLEPSEGLIAQNEILIAESQQLRVQHDKAIADDKFETLWETYGHKVGKQQARKAYHNARKAGANSDTLIAMAFRYKKWLDKHPDPPQQCHLSTWLNQERWEDELPEPRMSRRYMTYGERKEDSHAKLIELMAYKESTKDREIEQ